MGGIAATASVLLSPAQAHHSFAMFDRDQILVVEGTLTKFALITPHSWFWVRTPEGVDFAAEGGGPRDGKTPTAGYFVPGVKVKMTFHPYRDGRPGGEFLLLTSEDGSKQMGGPGPRLGAPK